MPEFFVVLLWILVGFCLGLIAAHLVSLCKDLVDRKNIKNFFN
jgi:hypothetical protein